MIRFWLILLSCCLPQLAWAQSNPAFSPLTLTPPPGDLTIQYLGNMFGVVGGALQGTGSQLLGSLFGVYNGAVLVLGGIIILYIVFTSLLATAHEGEVLGKRWSSIWIPLRAVMGIALLIPTASGYSFVQIFMMWVTTMGVGAADSMWNAALNSFLGGNTLIQSTQSNNSQQKRDLTWQMIAPAEALLQSLTCMAMLQTQFSNYAQTGANIQPPPDFLQGVLNTLSTLIAQNQSGGSLEFPSSNYYTTNGVCGSVSWQPVSVPNSVTDPTVSKRIAESRTVAIQELITQMYPVAIRIVNNFSSDNRLPLGKVTATTTDSNNMFNSMTWGSGIPGVTPLVSGDVLSQAATLYYGMMQAALNAQHIADQNNSWINDAKNKSWIEAGSYYYRLVSFNSQVSDLSNQGTFAPTFIAPSPTDFTTVKSLTSYLPVSPYVMNLQNLVNGSGAYAVGDNTFLQDLRNYGAFLLKQTSGSNSVDFSSIPSFGDAPKALRIVLNVFVGGIFNSVNGFYDLIKGSETQNSNPVLAIAKLGGGLISLSFMTFMTIITVSMAAAAGLGALWGFSVSVAAIAFALGVLALLTPVLLALLIAGLLMAFYIPLIPFLIFLFGVIGWFIAVVEAMLAAPLVALGIAHPEGHEILGQAEPAVILLTNVFLRPTLMIFGFLIGIQLSYVGIWLLNRGFWDSYFSFAKSVGNDSPITYLFFPITLVIIYTVIVQQILQKSFSLTYILPDGVYSWLGKSIAGKGGEGEAERAIHGQASSGIQTHGEATTSTFNKTMEGAQSVAGKLKGKEDERGGFGGNIQ